MAHAPESPHDHGGPDHHGPDGSHLHEHVDATDLPPPDEPRTPLWLTAVGGGLLLVATVIWLAARPAGLTMSELSPPPPTPAAAPPPPAPPPPPANTAVAAPPIQPAVIAPTPGGATGKPVKAKPKHKKAAPLEVRPNDNG